MIGNVQIIKNNGDALSSNGLAHFRFNDSDKEYIIYYLGEETEDGKKKIHVGYINGAVTEVGIGDDESAQITTLLKMIGKGEDVSPIATFLPLASQVFNIHDKVKKVGIPEKVMNNIINEQQKSQIANETPEVPADKPNTFFDESITNASAPAQQEAGNAVPNIFEQPAQPTPVPAQSTVTPEVPEQPAAMQVVQPEALASVGAQFQEQAPVSSANGGTISIDEAKSMMEQMQSEVNELFAKKIQEIGLHSSDIVETTNNVETIQMPEPVPEVVQPAEVEPQIMQQEVVQVPVEQAVETVQPEMTPQAIEPEVQQIVAEPAPAVETVQPEVAPAVIEEGPIQPEGPILSDASSGVDVVQSLELAPQHDIVPDVLGVESDLSTDSLQTEPAPVAETVQEVAPAPQVVQQVEETVQPQQVAQQPASIPVPEPTSTPVPEVPQQVVQVPEGVSEMSTLDVQPPAAQVAQVEQPPVMTNPQMVAPAPEPAPAIVDTSSGIIDTNGLIDTQNVSEGMVASTPMPQDTTSASVIDTTQQALVGAEEPNPMDEPAVVIASEQYSDFSQIPDVTPASNNDIPVVGPSADLTAIDTSVGGMQNDAMMPPQLETINGIPSPEQPPVSLPGNRVEENDFDLVTSQESFNQNKELVREQAA